MNVEENVRMGGWLFKGDRARVGTKFEANLDRFPVLRDRLRDQAGNLSWSTSRQPASLRSSLPVCTTSW